MQKVNEEYLDLEKPKNEHAKIWRYVDFTKFVSLLDKKALFFSRADKIGDPFEGSHPRENISLRARVYKDYDIRLETVSEIYKLLREFTAVNCWHLNEYESAAMWKLYLKSDEGIAIQSDFKRLKSSFIDNKYQIHVGKVQYVDYNIERIPDYPLSSFLYKRKSFSHEQELRAIIQKLPPKGITKRSKRPFDNGIYISVDLNLLINRIYLAPACPKWLFELTKSVTQKYGLDKEVKQSSLDDIPIY